MGITLFSIVQKPKVLSIYNNTRYIKVYIISNLFVHFDNFGYRKLAKPHNVLMCRDYVVIVLFFTIIIGTMRYALSRYNGTAFVITTFLL